MTRRDTAPPRRCGRAGASGWVSGFAAIVAVTASSAGCGGGTSTPDATVTEPQWWRPTYGSVQNWDIQLNPPFDVSSPRTMYVLDLWDLVPLPMTLDYGDGTPIPVVAGRLAGRVTELHARTPATVVICRVETGMLEMDRPDTAKFPDTAIGDAIPDSPPLAGRPHGKFLDIRATSRAAWAPVMFKRFDLARQIGCDGILPMHNDVGSYLKPTAFTITSDDVLSWYTEVAKQGHDRMLSVGLHGGETFPTTYEQELDSFDWAMIERCGEDMSCDLPAPFKRADKPVLALEYQTSLPDPDGDPPTMAVDQTATVCVRQQQEKNGVTEGLLKDDQLSSAFRMPCEPDDTSGGAALRAARRR